VLEFAKVMAISGIAIRQHLRGNPGACAAICIQAARWSMDPYTVGNKSYAVNDQLAFESQLITAVINTRAPIKGRLKTRFIGDGAKRKCIASAVFDGDSEPTEVTSPEIGSILPKNSPLWKTDPDQQLAYYTKRLWARRECPEVLLGVYDPDEIEAPRGPDTARDVTPARPTMAQFVEAEESQVDPAAAGHEDLDARFRQTTAETVDDQGEIHDTSAPSSDVQAEVTGAPAEATQAPAQAEGAQVAASDGYDAEAVRKALWEGALEQKSVAELDDYWNVQIYDRKRLHEHAPEIAVKLAGEIKTRRAVLGAGSGK
jgi:hypothetical protein